MEDYEQVYRATAHLIHRHGRLQSIISHNEYWMMLEARLREDFNVKYGYRTAEIARYKKKSEMKKVFESPLVGVKVARGRLVSSEADVTSLVTEIGWPAVIKPDIGVGAVGAFKLGNFADVSTFFNGYFLQHPQPYIMEEFIDGVIETFDGLTDRDGNVVFCASSRYGSGVMESMNDQMHYYLRREIPDDIRIPGLKMVSAFNVRGHYFHFEFFRTRKGQVVALEANLRLMGGFSIDMWNYANNLDMYKEWATVTRHNSVSQSLLQMKGATEGTHVAPYYCAFVSRKFKHSYKNSHDDVMRQCCVGDAVQERDVQMMMEITMPELFRSSMGDFAYIFRTKSSERLQEMIVFIQDLSV